ncbi:MAG: HEAT repeat domain-containing protein [Anaerolineae bacterium]
MRFHLAKDEEAAVRVTKQLGASKSPLTVEELLAALEDPRFNVRIEAVIAIAHHGPDPRLIDAVAEVLDGPEPALSTVAAWALGRMGDVRGLQPLRQAAQDSKYRSVRAHSLRSLGVLDDRESVPLALEGVAEESDVGMLLAHASMLGRMQVTEATDRLLALLASSPSRSSRREMALAVARLVGDENNFVTLLYQCDQEAGTALAQALLALRKRLDKGSAESSALEHCAKTLARHEVAAGIDELAELLQMLPSEQQAPHVAAIVQEAARRMRQYGIERLEYPILALHTLTVAWEAGAQSSV